MSHTPGPWRVAEDKPLDAMVVADVQLMPDQNKTYTLIICRAHSNTGPMSEPDQSLANARLIAAAPEMLEALEAAHRELLSVLDSINREVVPHDGDEFHERLGRIEAVIAKAKGAK